MKLGRRTVLGMIGAGMLPGIARNAQAAGAMTVYIGSFSNMDRQRGRGLEAGTADPVSGRLTIAAPVEGVPDASFLAISADRRRLYATNERHSNGTITALDIGSDPRRPAVLNRQPSRGGEPTHLSIHPGGRFLFTANYADGTVAVHPLLEDGRIGPSTDLVRHDAPKPNAHQVLADPSGRWVVAVDLGADAVYVYAFDPARGALTLNQQLKLPARLGPRHLAFHPGGGFAYILGERRSEITVAAWDAAAGRLTPGQVIGTLGGRTVSPNYPAEIQLSGDGRFLYASNRGDDSIATFGVEDAGARLTFRGTVPSGGAWPRHFTLDPSGRWLYTANQKAGKVCWMPRDPGTGTLGAVSGSATVNGAAMILFA